MHKTNKLFGIAAITAAIIFSLSGCKNQAMSSNETEYMYSDLAIEKALWEIVTGMTMTDMYITVAFDEPVRAERESGTWRPFTVSFDYSGSATTIITSPQNPDIDSSFTRTRGEEKNLYHFSITFNGVEGNADEFSNVRISYMAPMGTKIIGLSGAELKNFMDKPVTQKGAGGMGGH